MTSLTEYYFPGVYCSISGPPRLRLQSLSTRTIMLRQFARLLPIIALLGITQPASALLWEDTAPYLIIHDVRAIDTTEIDGDDIYLKIYRKTPIKAALPGLYTYELLHTTSVKTMHSGDKLNFSIPQIEFGYDSERLLVEVWDQDGGFRGEDDLLMQLEYQDSRKILPAFIAGEAPNWGDLDVEIWDRDALEESFQALQKAVGSKPSK